MFNLKKLCFAGIDQAIELNDNEQWEHDRDSS